MLARPGLRRCPRAHRAAHRARQVSSRWAWRVSRRYRASSASCVRCATDGSNPGVAGRPTRQPCASHAPHTVCAAPLTRICASACAADRGRGQLPRLLLVVLRLLQGGGARRAHARYRGGAPDVAAHARPPPRRAARAVRTHTLTLTLALALALALTLRGGARAGRGATAAGGRALILTLALALALALTLSLTLTC